MPTPLTLGIIKWLIANQLHRTCTSSWISRSRTHCLSLWLCESIIIPIICYRITRSNLIFMVKFLSQANLPMCCQFPNIIGMYLMTVYNFSKNSIFYQKWWKDFFYLSPYTHFRSNFLPLKFYFFKFFSIFSFACSIDLYTFFALHPSISAISCSVKSSK